MGRRGIWLVLRVLTTTLLIVAPLAVHAQTPPTPTSTATTVAPATTTTPPPTTTTLPASTTQPVGSTTTPPSTTTPAPATTAPLVVIHGTTTVAPAGAATSTTTTTARAGPPPASLSDAAVASVLDGLAKTSPSSNLDLLASIQPLLDLGLTPDQALQVGLGRFPVAGPAYFRDDFGDPRSTPEPHTHKGNDIFAAFGTPVRSPAHGVLRYADESAAGGLVAYVTEPDGTWYYLAHLQRFAPNLASGAAVKIGDVIGYNGDTGNAKGGAPHVHFEVHPKGGAAISPKSILDQWLTEAKAAVPMVLSAFRRDIQEVTRPLTNVALVRRFDRGMLDGPSRLLSPPAAPGDAITSDRRLADALLGPLTPPALAPDPNRPG